MIILVSSAVPTWPLDEGLVGSCDFGLRESYDLQVAQSEQTADLPTCRSADPPTPELDQLDYFYSVTLE